jgi:hypothetical protein
MGPIITGIPLSLEVAEAVRDGIPNCQTVIHLTMVITISVATFVMMSGLLGVTMGKEPPRDLNTAISLDADPKNPWYLRCLSTARLTQYAATDLWITTTELLKYAVFWEISTEVSCETQTRYTRGMQFRWGVAWKGRGWRTALEVSTPGVTLGLGVDIVGLEMLSASKLFATRIFVESEHTPPSCVPPPFFDLYFYFLLHIHYEIDYCLPMFMLVSQVQGIFT